MEHSGQYYLINHLVLISGLTDRTIRNYISSGILQGEKINGLWHFTPEQVEAFLQHPAMRPSILAKHNSSVYDFLLNPNKTEFEFCMILDISGRNQQDVAEFFVIASTMRISRIFVFRLMLWPACRALF